MDLKIKSKKQKEEKMSYVGEFVKLGSFNTGKPQCKKPHFSLFK